MFTGLLLLVVIVSGCSGGGGDSDTASTTTSPNTSTSVVTTFAGTSLVGSTNATGVAASFSMPSGITNDGTNLYVTDTSNNIIRKIVIATGAVTTLAGTANALGGTADGTGSAASFLTPSGITTDGTNLYVTTSYGGSIRKIVIATGVVTTLSGAAAAGLTWPSGITTDGSNLFVTDFGKYTIRKTVIATGVTTTLAGTANSGGTADGTGAAALFITPMGIATDNTNLYVTDGNRIRKIVIATGVVTTLAGSTSSGSVDGTGTAARFDTPIGITIEGNNLYVADMYSQAIRKIDTASGMVTTVAGQLGVRGKVDGTGTAAKFDNPAGITRVGTTYYVADSGSNLIRKMQ